MVKLLFNPTNNKLNNNFVPESKSSKKQLLPSNLNPFQDIDNDYITLKNNSSYIPTKNLIGLENTHYIIKTWYETSIVDITNTFLLLIGPTGCGKSSLIKSFCKEENILLYSVNNDKSKEDTINDILNFSGYVSSEGTNFFTKSVKNKKLILIDEYQNCKNDILSVSDINNMFLLRKNFGRKMSSSIIKEIKTTFNDQNINNLIPPIIIISADTKGSKLSELKKITNVYYIGEINKNIIKTWIQSFLKCSHLKSSDLDNLINKCKSDKRLLINTIEFLKYNKSNSVDQYIESFYKDNDLNQFDFIEKLFDNIEPIDIDEIFKIYETDGYLLANMAHENYLDYSDDIESLANCADSISLGETIYSNMFDTTREFIPYVHCTHSLYIPSYYARSNVKKNKCQLRSSVINNRYNIYLMNLD
jgi:predicted AAA+ superfamily ATPase